MGPHLLSLIKQHDYRGIPIRLCKSICRQILVGLEFLHDTCQVGATGERSAADAMH